jgi:His/Glu/Gln/Arg/opine family amino acid ABC transporter permease subunit
VSVADFISLLEGAAATLSLSLLGFAVGVPLGLLIALLRWARVPLLAPVAAAYVSLVRATPLITLVLVIFFVVPAIHIDIPPVPAAVLALAVSTSAFSSEFWRAALLNFPREQLDAAAAFGMRRGLRFGRIVLPQIARGSLPALVNELAILIKISPAIAIVGVVDITRAAVRIGENTYRPLPPFTVALVLYTVIVAVFVFAQSRLERRLHPKEA